MKIIYKENKYSDEDMINKIYDKFQDYTIQKGNIIGCILHEPIVVISVWLALRKIEAIPVFIPAYFSKDMKENIYKDIKMDYVIENKNHTIEIYKMEEKSILKISCGSIIFTSSASTGKPKLILRSQEQLEAEFLRYKKALDMSENDVFLPMVPLYHAYGFMCTLFAAYKLNATIVVPHVIFPRIIISLIEKNKVSFIYGVPELYRQILSLKLKELPKSLKYLFSSSVPIENELLEQFFKQYSYYITQQYGSTETGSIAFSRLKDKKNEFSVFLDDTSIKCEKYDQGNNLYEIYISSPTTIGSYIYENTVQLLDVNKYRTLDYGILKDGILTIYGRIDDIISIAGKKISKKYMEKIMKRFNDLSYVKITYEKGELTCRYKLNKKDSLQNFIEFCEKQLPAFSYPKKYISIENNDNINWKEEKNGKI